MHNLQRHPRGGFSLIELVVVILILSVLAGALVPRVTDRMAAARDARRMQDVSTIRDAVEQYHLDKGAYPPPVNNAAFGGWDVSQDGNFITELVETGYLREPPTDPINDDTYHYRYYVYPQGSGGCVSDGPFYVLGIRNFETEDARTKNQGYFKCSTRDWGLEFDWVTGGGASER